MNPKRYPVIILHAILLIIPISVSALAQHAGHQHDANQSADSQKFLGKGDGIDTCPVTGEPITARNIKAEFFGRTVYFCCPGCMEKAKKSPELYLKPTAEAQASALEQEAKKFLGKGDGVTTCPVTGEPVNKDLKGEVNGRTFLVCCEGCIDTVKKNPDLYLKPQSHGDHGHAEAGKFLGKGDGVTTCPVTGEPINKEVKAEINGRVVYACCEGCLDQVKKNPDLYLKKN